MAGKIVTISREFGSGGRTVGRKLAEKLGIPCYDAELIQKIAEESGFAADYVEEQSDMSAGGWFSTLFIDRSNGLTNQDQLWVIQKRVIMDIADQGPCVIVGRCADYILKDSYELLTAFIHADIEFRAKRIVEEYGEREESPVERLKDKDKRRAAYHRFYTDMKWGQAQNYDVCLNSGRLGIDRCVEILAELY